MSGDPVRCNEAGATTDALSAPVDRRITSGDLRCARRKWGAALLVVMACFPLYLVPAQMTGARAATLTLANWERAIPFWPASVWPYLAQYPLLIVSYATCPDPARCARFLRAALLVQAGAAIAYLVAPLRYPRVALAADAHLDPLTTTLVRWVQAIDAPVNCCPSLHVSSCLLCVWLGGSDRAPSTPGLRLVALASVASTLTFKQHYAIDLPAGALLAAIGWWAAGKLA